MFIPAVQHLVPRIPSLSQMPATNVSTVYSLIHRHTTSALHKGLFKRENLETAEMLSFQQLSRSINMWTHGFDLLLHIYNVVVFH